jgi:hypothetical protein
VIRAILVAAALAAAPSVSSSAEPTWLGYPTGVAEAAKAKKPMFVLVGDWADKLFDDDMKQTLADVFVTVRVDTNTPYGRALAEKFEMARGLVISGPGGTSQAYSLSGTLTKRELAQVIWDHADPDFKFDKTTSVIREKPPVRALPPEWRVVLPAQYTSGST